MVNLDMKSQDEATPGLAFVERLVANVSESLFEKIAYIDMDGVLADLHSSSLEVFGQTYVAEKWPPGEYSIAAALGITPEDMWPQIDAHPNFWASLKPYPWAWALLAAVRSWGYRPVICTQPHGVPTRAFQKLQWMQTHLHPNWRDYHICERKEELAKPGRILIDDSDDNCQKFAAAGGTSILFPQRWNSMHEVWDGYRYVLFRLEELP